MTKASKARAICACPQPTDSIRSHGDSFFRIHSSTALKNCRETMILFIPCLRVRTSEKKMASTPHGRRYQFKETSGNLKDI